MSSVTALVAATLLLILIPGPNVALIVASSLRHGLRFGLVTAAGTTAGLGLQLFLVVVGMATLIELAASALLWIKWLGVAYLLYLGVRTWREPPQDLAALGVQTATVTFWRGFGLAIINPKTLLFNAAFLPQFVSGTGDAGAALLSVAAIFLSVIIVGDALWAVFAAGARPWLTGFGRLRNRVTGGFLVGAGLGLALSRRAI
jgi:threonine/homoserine/homoserine lactone efflux protein